MMIAELIDGDDFRRRLVELGIAIDEGASPDTCARVAQEQHQQAAVQGLPELVRELEQKREITLPSVREAIERHLRFPE